MRLTKWDGAPDSTKTTLLGGGGGDSSGSEQPPSRGDEPRQIWGQTDEGDDIDGTATVNGNVIIKTIIPPTYDPDDEDSDGENEEEETGGGNLDVELDATVGRHLYINYPHPNHQGEKKCVGELIKTNADAISSLNVKVENNTTNIANLTTKVNTNTTNIANLTQTVNNNTTNISNNADEISKLKAGSLTEEDVLKLIRNNQPSKLGAYDQPVVLMSGRLRRVTYYTDKWYDGEMIKLPQIGSVTNSINGGLMTLNFAPIDGYRIHIYGIHCTQEQSGDTTDQIDNPTVNGRSDGAHWFECRTDNVYGATKIYIREFHQKNGNNDSWGSDYWGGDGGGIKAVWLTVVGWIQPIA